MVFDHNPMDVLLYLLLLGGSVCPLQGRHVFEGKDVTTAHTDHYVNPLPNNWMDYIKDVKVLISKLKQNLSTDCNNTLNSFDYIELGQYIDSWGKPSSRILYGNSLWYGAYEECQGIPSSHYCLADMVLLNKKQLLNGVYGICTPNQCTQTDVNMILQQINKIKIFNMEFNNIIEFPSEGLFAQKYGFPVVCEDKTELPGDTKACLWLIGILSALCLFGTVLDGLSDILTPEHCIPRVSTMNSSYEVTTDSKGKLEDRDINLEKSDISQLNLVRGNKCTNFFICFSILKNIKTLLSTKKAADGITSVNGIRSISISWVVLGHVFFYAISDRVDNPVTAFKVVQRFSFQAVANAYVSVDSFFLLSGLLVAYLGLKKMDKSSGKLNIIVFYLHRFLRLTPSYMFIIFVYTSLYPYLLNSPQGVLAKAETDNVCSKYWWTNLLYINNFHPASLQDECLGWSWYLANDMQFYIISPIFLYIMYHFKLKGTLISTGISLAICIAINAALTAAYNLPALITELWLPHPRVTKEEVVRFGDDIYIKPYTRCGPYIIGLLLGYLLKRNMSLFKGRKLTVAIIGWIIAVVIGMSVIYGPYTAFKPNGTPFSKVQDIFYGSLGRIGWSIALAWVIYSCHYKAGGIINSFLSWSGWIPLSRLSYGVYLWHPVVFNYYYKGSQNPVHYQDESMVFIFVAVLGISHALAFFTALLIDLPVGNLEQQIIR